MESSCEEDIAEGIEERKNALGDENSRCGDGENKEFENKRTRNKLL
jgi:hypothetical protein